MAPTVEAESLVMPSILVGPTKPSRRQICVRMPGPIGLGAPSGPLRWLISGSLVVVPFFSFLYWSYQPHWGRAGQLRHKAVWAK